MVRVSAVGTMFAPNSPPPPTRWIDGHHTHPSFFFNDIIIEIGRSEEHHKAIPLSTEDENDFA